MPTLQDVIWTRDLIPYIHITLLGVDITADVMSEEHHGVDGIEINLDYPQINVFKTSNIILTLSNHDGKYSPDNPNNFFITHGDAKVANSLKADGFGAKVSVDIGKVVDGASISRRIFVGTIVDLELIAKPAQVKLTCVDAQQSLREAVIQDFGIDRWLETVLVDNSLPWGTYRVPEFMTPISEESVVATKSDGNELTNVEQIRTEGRIRADAYGVKYERGEIRTEGGRLSSPPRLKFKEQYRWRFVDGLVREILTHTGVTAGTIDIPQYSVDEPVMSSHGRVGWHTEWRQRGRTAASAAGWTGYAKDFVFKSDGTEAVFVYGGKGSQNAILHYDFASDTWTTLYEPAKPIELWRVASADFNDIYVLGTDTGVYDVLTGGSIKIWRYRKSTDTWLVVTGASDPQLASPYHFGTPITTKHAKLSLFPDTRHLFESSGSDVFYRKANASRLGVRSIANDYDLDFAHPAVDDLNYAYDGFVEGNYLYLVYITGTLNQKLKVERQLISNPTGNASDVLEISLSNPVSYFYFGVSNIVSDGSDGFWCVLQKGLPRQGLGSPIPGFLGDGVHYPGIGDLCYISYAGSGSRTVLYSNNYGSGATGGVRLESGLALYFLGGIYQHDSPFLEEEAGNLVEVTKTKAVITDRSWTSFFVEEARLLDRCISPFRKKGDSVNFVVGFDPPDSAMGFDVDPPKNAQSLQNWLWQEISADVPLKLPVLTTHRLRAWDVLTELATITHTTIGIEQDKFTMRTRDAVRSRLTNDLLVADMIVQAKTDGFPDSGYLLIRQEVIKYSSKTADRFTVASRGEHNSTAAGYSAGAEIILVNAFAFDHAVDSNLISVNLEPDFLNLYNQVTVRYGDDNRAYAEDSESVSAYGERPYQLELANLSEHERDWADRLAKSYLKETSKIRSLITMRLRWSPELEIGQIVVVHHDDKIHLDWIPCRILRIYHDVARWETHITAKEIAREDLQAPQIGEILLPRLRVGEYFSYRIPATGNPDPRFTITNLPTGLTLDASTGDIKGTPSTTGESSETVTATNSEGNDTKPIVFDVRPESSFPTLTFAGVTIPTVIVIKKDCYVDMQFPAAIGGKPPVQYELTGIPTTMKFDSATRRLTGISRTAGDTDIHYSVVDSSTPEQSVVYASSVDLKTETIGEWSGLLIFDASKTVGVTDYKANLIDNPSNFSRQYDADTGDREVLNFADIFLGTGDWTGCVATSNRKIFLDNAGNRAVFYDLDNKLQASEQINLGVGDWQDVCLVGSNRLGFLDRDTGAVRVYNASTRAREASDDIVFGFDAKFRSIAPNAGFTSLFVLIENLGALLVWNITGKAFNYGSSFTLVEGTTDWQSVMLHPSGHLLAIHKRSIAALGFTTAGARDKSKDIVLR